MRDTVPSVVSTGQSWKVRTKPRGILLKTFHVSGTSIDCGIYSITSENIENYEDFIVTDLKITNSATGEERHVCHFQFTSWPDYGTPDSALSMLQFLQVRLQTLPMVAGMCFTG